MANDIIVLNSACYKNLRPRILTAHLRPHLRRPTCQTTAQYIKPSFTSSLFLFIKYQPFPDNKNKTNNNKMLRPIIIYSLYLNTYIVTYQPHSAGQKFFPPQYHCTASLIQLSAEISCFVALPPSAVLLRRTGRRVASINYNNHFIPIPLRLPSFAKGFAGGERPSGYGFVPTPLRLLPSPRRDSWYFSAR